jgi:hypothetical protein
MRLPFLRLIITFSAVVFLAVIASAQLLDNTDKETMRVTVSLNADGSRTSYRFDQANKKATAITTAPDGKVREKIRYVLDDNGRFVSGVISDAGGQFRFKALYKYDGSGRLQEETHIDKGDAVMNKIVYSYDQAGKQTGYAIFDASGKLIGKTSAAAPSAKAAQKKP